MSRHASLQPVFKALADPTRRQILEILSGRKLTIGDIAAQFEITRPAIAKHLRVLEAAELIHVTVKGRERRITLSSKALGGAAAWLGAFEALPDDRPTMPAPWQA